MREHKYRAWHKISKKMDEVTELCTWRHLVYVATEQLSWTYNDSELMQFTGLKDKNGKEIYEGDIVTSHTPFDYWADKFSVVKYENGTWNYSYALQEFSDTPEKQWEVIGNIYENQDLLEVHDE